MGSVAADSHLNRGYDGGSQLSAGAGSYPSHADGLPVRQSTSRPQSSYGNYDDEGRGAASQHLDDAGLKRTASSASRSGTLKKKNSLSRKGSLKRSGSKRSLRAGSIKGVTPGASHRDASHMNDVFSTPIPTSGSPTEVLANRFGTWRKILKDLITYFREVQTSYEHRAKALLKVSNVINNVPAPPGFLIQGGLLDANNILRDYHRQSIAESNKAKDIESDVINHLNGLRQDLAAKIKEIKSLSGDFKNSVEKEKDATRKAVAHLEEALQVAHHDPEALVGKDDPFIIRLGVDRQVERQVDEENYLHRAYLNLEGSGRELESIVVGEIQKAYNALAGILKREADEAYDTVEKLRSGPISLPKDNDWIHFVENDEHFVNPEIPLRKVEDIEYPGKNAPAAAEVRAGMLERKSKYLKSYTPGWYVLSPTHLHEFKSADRIYTQPPVMSLLLGDQKLGSRSAPDGSSHKFMLKGKQTGAMHRGHSWVFRAESYDTMLAWYDDIKTLTETSPAERDAFVRRHARSVSAGSVSGESVMDEDEADRIPFSAVQSRDAALNPQHEELKRPQRPSPGRFPSDFQANQYLNTPGNRPVSPSSGSSVDGRDFAATRNTAHPPGGGIDHHISNNPSVQQSPVLQQTQQGFQPRHQPQPLSDGAYSNAAAPANVTGPSPVQQSPLGSDNDRSGLLAGAGAGLGVGAGALGAEEYWRLKHQADKEAAAIAAPDASEGKSAAVSDVEKRSTVSDAEKVATANAMPPSITASAVASPRGHGQDGDRAISDAGTATTTATGFTSATALTTSTTNASAATGRTSLTSVDDGGQQAGKEVVVTHPTVASSNSAAPSAVQPIPTDKPVVDEPNATFGHTAYDTSPVDGHVNAKATGAIFPRIMRHDTNVSVTDLHVPGEWRSQ